ncbi:MAG: hypothetical protein ACI84O_000818 [Myxococcota bacterium]|jgi:hypothetical protein
MLKKSILTCLVFTTTALWLSDWPVQNPAPPPISDSPQAIISKQFDAVKVPITRDSVYRSLQDNALTTFLHELQIAKSMSDKKPLQSQCRTYLVGFEQLPHASHTWGAFLHDLFSACYSNEFASEVVARALFGQHVISEQELDLILDVRPTSVDDAINQHCYWQATLFINALDILFVAAIANGNTSVVEPFLQDKSSRIRALAFTALYPNLSASEFAQFSDFFAGLDSSEQKLLAEYIADTYQPNEAAGILRDMVNQQQANLLGAFCKVAMRDHLAIELLLNDAFDSFTDEQARFIKDSAGMHSPSKNIMLLEKEGLLRRQLLDAYFTAGIGQAAKTLDLSVIEWIARLDNNPLIRQQAIDFLLTIDQGNGKEMARTLLEEIELETGQ